MRKSLDYREVGERVRTFRTGKHLSQRQLAELVHSGESHISHLERGEGSFSTRTLYNIAEHLQCSVDELLPPYGSYLPPDELSILDISRKLTFSRLPGYSQFLYEMKADLDARGIL